MLVRGLLNFGRLGRPFTISLNEYESVNKQCNALQKEKAADIARHSAALFWYCLWKIAVIFPGMVGYFLCVITKTSVAKFIISDKDSYTVMGGQLLLKREDRFLLCLACPIFLLCYNVSKYGKIFFRKKNQERFQTSWSLTTMRLHPRLLTYFKSS